MRRLIVSTFLTLDGVMQAPGGPEEDETGGFSHGGWAFTYWDEVVDSAMGEAMSVPFALVLGRKTYDVFAAHWPNAGDADGAGPMNAATKYVASRSRPTLEWSNSELLGEDVVASLAALKREDGPELQVTGSGDLAQTLIPSGLVDEYRLMIFPVLLGGGKRLFAEGTVPAGLKLTKCISSTTGVMIATYEPAGELLTGSFGLEQDG